MTLRRRQQKNELAYLSLPRPLSCITSCLSYHLASPYPERPGQYLEPLRLHYSISSRPAEAKECSESGDLFPDSHSGQRPYLGLPGPQTQLPLNTPGRTTFGQGHLQIHTFIPNKSQTTTLIGQWMSTPNRIGGAKYDMRESAWPFACQSAKANIKTGVGATTAFMPGCKQQ